MLCALAFYMYIGFCVPYCHDDWDWGLDIGLQNWLHAALNSRYVGSFFVVAMTRAEWFKTLVIGLSMFLCPLMIAGMSGRRDGNIAFILANVFLLIMPQTMWQQTYGWVSGFANYVVPVPWLLFLIMVMEKSAKEVKRWYWLCVPLAAALCLFVENLTVYVLGACVLFTAVCAVRDRRVNPFHIAMCIALALGFAIMFSSAMYGELLDEGRALDGIRKLTVTRGSGIQEFLRIWGRRFYRTLIMSLFCESPIAPNCVSLALIAAVLKRKVSGGTIVLSLLTVVLNVCIYFELEDTVFQWFLPQTLLVCLFVLIVMSREKVAKKLFLLVSALAVMLPLVVAIETGPRLFFMSYVFLMTLAVMSFPETESKRLGRAALCVSAAALAACFAFYINIFSQIRAVTAARAEAIASAVENGDSTVFIKKDPHKYWWGRDPVSQERVVYFKEFYGIPQDMEVIFESGAPEE